MTIKKQLAVVASVLAAVWCGSAAAECIIHDCGFTNTTATTLSYTTNRYDGAGHVISGDLILENNSYLRLKGSLKSGTPDSLAFGPADANAANQCPTFTIRNSSAFYISYRGSSTADPDTDNLRHYLTTTIGENGGRAKFVVQSKGSSFGSNISNIGLWLDVLAIHANATGENGYIDFLQLDAGGAADIDNVIVNSATPARIIFNGGKIYDNYNYSGSTAPLQPATGKTLVLEGTNGNSVIIEKAYYTHVLNGGNGTLRFQGKCNVQLDDSGVNLPGVGNGNRSALTLDSTKGPIEWAQEGDLVLGAQAHVKCRGDNRLPYLATQGIVRLTGNKYYGAILDLDGTSQCLRSLISEASKTMVTNVAHSTYTKSKLVFGTNDTDGVFSAHTYYGVSVDKIGTGTLVVSNATIDVNETGTGKFTVKEGTVLLAGTNKIGTTNMYESAYLTIEEGAEVIREIVVNVDSGSVIKNNAYTNDWTGVKVRLRKTGAGTLVLNNAGNTFSGGLVIDEGVVKVTAAGAQGAGKITVNSTSTNICNITFATIPAVVGGTVGEVEYANDIEVTGRSSAYPTPGNYNSTTLDYAAVIIAQTNQVLTGSITGLDDLYIRDYDGNERKPAALIMRGAITVESGHALMFSVGSAMQIHGKITADELYLPACAGGLRNVLYLRNAENAIGKIFLDSSTENCKLYNPTVGALGGASLTWLRPWDKDYHQSDIRGTFDPNVNTFIQSLAGPDWLRPEDVATRCGYTIGCNVQNEITLTITGRTDVAATQFCGGFGNTKQSLVVDADGFTQIFSNVLYFCKNELKVKSGTLVIAGKSYFPNLETITVEGGVLDIRDLGSVADETANALPSLKTINVNSGAQVKLAEGIWLSAATVKVDGFQLNAETYTSGSTPGLNWLSGEGSLTATASPTLPVEATDATWCGSGTDASTLTEANWETTPAPAFYYHGYRPVFGTGGSEALFPSGVSYLNGIKFTREGDFTVKGAEGATLQLGATIDVRDGVDSETAHTYEITAPIEVATAWQTWAVPSNQTLKLSGGLSLTNGASSMPLTKTGWGELHLTNARYKGNLNANTEGCGMLKLTGDIGVEGDSGKLAYRNYNYSSTVDPEKGKRTSYINGYLHLDGATVYKPFVFSSGGQVDCWNGNNAITWLTTTEGSTNIFKEAVTHAGSSLWLLNSDVTVIFEKGYGDIAVNSGGGFNPGMMPGCTNGTMIFTGPVKMINTSKGTLSSSSAYTGLKMVFDCTGNCCTNGFVLNYYTTVFKQNDAFMGTKSFTLDQGGNASVVDLTTTRQSIPIFKVNGHGVIQGERGELVITEGPANESAATTTNFNPNAINGWVKLTMRGDGYQKIGGTYTKNYASYGDLEVSGGTLELLDKTTWLNGTNLYVNGTGKLKLSASNLAQIGPQAVVHFGGANEDSTSNIEIPSGVTYTVEAIYVGDTRLPPGTYDGSSGDLSGRITGGGKLRVKNGTMLIFR